jgi:tRNA (cmo5U34)-methyltransferase
MSRDTLYATENVESGPFEFNEEVAQVFPDMLKRSIPGYAASIQAIGTLAASLVQPNSRCYDLGCSLGAATLAMRRNIKAAGCRIIAVDNAPAMVSRCRELLAIDKKAGPAEVSVIEANLQEVDITRASMVVMNYTLQFLPLEERPMIIRKIAKGMNPGGILVLSEKVVDEDPVVEEKLQNLHHEFKQRNAYSDLEISRKRAALENILVPETVNTHKQRLTDAGFSHVGVWLRYFNFVSIIAIR